LADFISLWREEKQGARRDTLPVAETFTPKPRVWLRTSQVIISGGHLRFLGLLDQAWQVQSSLKPVLFGSEWLTARRNEPEVTFDTRLAARGVQTAAIHQLAWQLVGRIEAPNRAEVCQPSFTIGTQDPAGLPARPPRPAISSRTLEVWQPNGLGCPPTFSMREKRVNPPVRTWIGGLKPAIPRPGMALKTVPLPPLGAFNSYSRRYQPSPFKSTSGQTVYPQPANSIR
jgi:hypothetical protein